MCSTSRIQDGTTFSQSSNEKWSVNVTNSDVWCAESISDQSQSFHMSIVTYRHYGLQSDPYPYSYDSPILM